MHFGHAKVQALRGITDDDIVHNWNEVVTKRDVVYVLGDVFQLARVPELRGTKKLALGNHDRRPADWYLNYFSQVRAMFEWDNCLLTHIPVHPNQRHRYRLNVHGHLHAHVVERDYVTRHGWKGSEPDSWYRCVSLEQTDFRPVLLRDVTEI